VFAFERSPVDPLLVTITLTATNHGVDSIEDFVFQAAVPKVGSKEEMYNMKSEFLFVFHEFICCS